MLKLVIFGILCWKHLTTEIEKIAELGICIILLMRVDTLFSKLHVSQ